MPGTPVPLGPFIGGINTQSDPSSIDDSELVDCINLELDLDGSLISRPPLQEVTPASISVMGGRVLCLGYGLFSSNRYYLFGCGPAGVGVYYSGVWTLIAPGVKSKSIAQLMDESGKEFVWIVATKNSTNGGGKYHPDVSSSIVNVPSMPRGGKILSYKSRLWICAGLEAISPNESRVWYSSFDETTGTFKPSTWNTGVDWFDVNPGDGQKAVTMTVYNDTLTVFKNDSTYTIPFDADPDLAVIRKIADVGATKDFCVVNYENFLYLYWEGWVYEVNGTNFARINTKVPFIYEAPSLTPDEEDVYVTLFGDRLIVRYYRRVYVFGLKTRTWTRFFSTLATGPFVAAPSSLVQRKNQVYYCGSFFQGVAKQFKIQDGFDDIAKEEMTCTIITKIYDMRSSHKFKKLFWWGVDCSSVDPVQGSVRLAGFKFVTTWGAASAYKWVDLDTWGEPTPVDSAGSITSLVPTLGNRPSRIFVKFFKAMRYRQINFTVVTTTDGSLSRGPVRIYGIMAFTNIKETVVAAVS